jgi:hypothetical protein
MGYYRRGMGGLSPLGQAIATAEGAPPSTNNPGDLELGDIGFGTYTAAGGQLITNFPTLAAGQTALENQINLIASGASKAGYTPSMSIAQVGNLYTGSSSGAWANNVASALGITPDTNFASLVGGAPTSSAAVAAGSAGASVDTSGVSVLDVLSSMAPSTDTTPYIVGGLAVLAALVYALS